MNQLKQYALWNCSALFPFFYLSLLLLLLTLPELSFSADFHSPRSDALGGAGHASPFLGDVIYLNPSFGSFVPAHSLSVNYLNYYNGQTTNPHGELTDFYGHNINASLMDGSRDALFQAGVGYTRRDDGTLVHLALSKQLHDRISIGLGPKMVFPVNHPGTRIVDGSISGTVIITQWLQASLIVDNALNSGNSAGLYRESILGTKVSLSNIVLLYVDPHVFAGLPTDQATFGYQAGAEIPFATDFFLRLGTFRNSTIPYEAQRGNGAGIGFAWVAPKMSFDYAFSKVTSPIAALSHNVGVTIYF